MSRAFVNEDAEAQPPRHFALPPVDDPAYDAAAALAILEAARDGQLHAAEDATGYRWGASQLLPHVERFLSAEEERPEALQDRRFMTMARRYIRRSVASNTEDS